MCALHLLRTKLNLGSEKKSSQVKNVGVVNSAIRAIFIIRQCKKLAAEGWNDFRLKNFILKFFQKTNAISATFGPRYIHEQSLKEIDFPTRNAVDRFYRDCLLNVVY